MSPSPAAPYTSFHELTRRGLQERGQNARSHTVRDLAFVEKGRTPVSGRHHAGRKRPTSSWRPDPERPEKGQTAVLEELSFPSSLYQGSRASSSSRTAAVEKGDRCQQEELPTVGQPCYHVEKGTGIRRPGSGLHPDLVLLAHQEKGQDANACVARERRPRRTLRKGRQIPTTSSRHAEHVVDIERRRQGPPDHLSQRGCARWDVSPADAKRRRQDPSGAASTVPDGRSTRLRWDSKRRRFTA